jgi:hypothetical protein
MKDLINRYSGFMKVRGGELIFPEDDEYKSLSRDISKLNISDNDKKKLVIKPIKFNF